MKRLIKLLRELCATRMSHYEARKRLILSDDPVIRPPKRSYFVSKEGAD